MIGRTLLHYRIEEALGEGAMGVVYRARDTKLGRDVALKVLPEDLASDPDRLDRFRREARALAAIDHPSIVTIYSVEEHDGTHFLTMALVHGEDLETKLHGLHGLHGGKVSLSRFYDIATQLASALAAAHERNIVHRDLKPSNVMETDDGRVVILDFGLAKVTNQGEPDEELTDVRTRDGMVMGTAPYMSPEQIQGLSLDQRSDIFSLGIMFYEMLSGSRPFTGKSAPALFSSTLRDDPPPIAGCPGELSRIVLKCLAKKPEERYQTSSEIRSALDELHRSRAAATAEPRDQKTIVVLPFVNRSPDPDNEYFSDGLTEEVISDLARVAALRVISRNSAMALKGTTRDTSSLARELGVSHLVTGAVRRAGNALRVTAELVDAKTDTPIWSEKYSGTAEDVFGIQEEISRKIVSALEVKLTDTEAQRVGRRPIENALAYDGYLRARQEMYVWTSEASRRALRLVDDALGIVGDNPLLLATKGQIHWINANVSLEPADESLDLAQGFVERALELQPDSHLGIFVRGLIAGLRGRVEQALADLRRAHELEPGDANVLTELCRFANAAGLRTQKALVEECVRIDPLTPITHCVVATYHSVNGLALEGVEAARRTIEMAPGASALHIFSAWQLAEAGLRAEAAQVLGRVGSALQGTLQGSWALFLENALSGNVEAAAQHAAQGLDRMRVDHWAHTIASAFALLGKTSDAVRWTAIAIDSGFINYPCLTRHDPFLESVRMDPEFQKLMESLKGRWEAAVTWERDNGL